MIFRIEPHATATWEFFLLLIPAGPVIGCTEIVLNVEADRTEALIGRRIMNRAHAFWSIGFFSGGLIGATMAHFGVSPQIHLALIVPTSLFGVAFLLGGFKPAPARVSATPHAEHRIARPTGPILVLVCVTLSAMLMEGAGIDWSAIYMRNLFGASPLLTGFAVAVIAGSQALGLSLPKTLSGYPKVQLHGANCYWLPVLCGAPVLVMESADVGTRDNDPPLYQRTAS